MWVGRGLFGCDDPLYRGNLSTVRIPNEPISFDLDPELHHEQPLINMNIRGYFQYHTESYIKYRDYFRSLFEPTPEVTSKLNPGLKYLRSGGKTIVGLHLRRGDFGFDKFFVAPSKWYKEYLSTFWSGLKSPVLFIASDEIDRVTEDFSKYNPVTVKDFGIDTNFFNQSKKKACYPDFYFLSKCNAVAISNSSFSFAACMLNENAKIFMRPRLSLKKLIPFDPWNSIPLLRDERVEDYE